MKPVAAVFTRAPNPPLLSKLRKCLKTSANELTAMMDATSKSAIVRLVPSKQLVFLLLFLVLPCGNFTKRQG